MTHSAGIVFQKSGVQVFRDPGVEVLRNGKTLKDVDVFRCRSAFVEASARQPSPETSVASKSAITVGTPSLSPLAEGEGWWRRRESF